MPLPDFSSNTTDIRTGGALAIYPIVNENYTLVQFRPSGSASSRDNGSITSGTIVSGAVANVPVGATGFITPTSDYRNDLMTNRDACVIFAVRAEHDGTKFDTTTLGYEWDSSDYVTIIAEARPQEFPYRVPSDTDLRWFDLSYQDPKPRITFVHDVVVTSGASVSYSPVSNADTSKRWTFTAMTPSGTINSYKWGTIVKNGSGFTATLSASTSSNPSLTLPLGVNWIICTVTDDNSVTNTVWAMVAVIPDTFNSIVTDSASSWSWNYNNEPDGMVSAASSGANAVFEADGDSLLSGSPMMLFGRTTYDGGTTEDRVCHFGYIASISGTTDANNISSVSVTIDGVIEALRRLNLESYPVEYNASPTTWGQLERNSLFDYAWFALSYHIVNPPSIAYTDGSVDLLNFRKASDQTPSGDPYTVLATMMLRCAYAPTVTASGEIRITIDAALDPDITNRATISDIATLDSDDFEILGIFAEPQVVLRNVRLSCDIWADGINEDRTIEAGSPDVDLAGSIGERFDGRVYSFQPASEPVDTLVWAGQLAYNIFALSNLNAIIELEINPFFHALIPERGRVLDFTYAATENLLGLSRVNAKLLVLGVSVNSGATDGAVQMRVRLGLRTGGQSNYSQFAFLVIPDDGTDEEYPAGDSAPKVDYGGNPNDNRDDAGEDDKSLPPEDQDRYRPIKPEAAMYIVPFNGENVTVPSQGSAITMTSGSEYDINVRGYGVLLGVNQTLNYDFTSGEQGWEVYTQSNGATIGQYSGSGWTFEDERSPPVTGAFTRQTTIVYDFGSDVDVADVVINSDFTTGGFIGSTDAEFIEFLNSGGSKITSDTDSAPNQSGNTSIAHVADFGGATVTGVRKVVVRLFISQQGTIGALSGSGTISSVAITLANANKRYGDAISYWEGATPNDGVQVEFGTTEGLIVNGGTRLANNAENKTHIYSVVYTASGGDDGNNFSFQFVDPDGSYTENTLYMIVLVTPL